MVEMFATEVELHPQSAKFNLHTPQGIRAVDPVCRCT